MRVLVCTVVHLPLDARVHGREITALVEAGHEVTYAAPWSAYGETPPGDVRPIDLPRAHGRRRLRALLAARRLLAEQVDAHDITILHNPELLLALPRRRTSPVVWDIHEDTAAALVDKRWLPGALRPLVRAAVSVAERRAERHLHLLLAEVAYQERFARPHPVVPNQPPVPEAVPPPGDERLVYLGRVSRGRGAELLVALGATLPTGMSLEVIGQADDDVAPLLADATERGVLRWHGFVPNETALELLHGALAGLSLLRDLPNYRHSRPTKVVEYMAAGVPVITTPNPLAAALVRDHRCGLVVPFDDAAAALRAALWLREHPEQREQIGAAGHAAAVDHFSWQAAAQTFVAQLERWAEPGSS